MFNKTVFFIRSKSTGVMWSRNRWATAASTPDFFDSRKSAALQVEKGKISLIERHRSMKAEIVEATIVEAAV